MEKDLTESSTYTGKVKYIQSERIGKFQVNNIFNRILKRIFDLIIAIIGLVLLSPFFLLIAILVKRDSPGPIFFWCKRMGKGERPFKMLKFRTMYERESSYQGLPVTCEDDERITPMGHWLRDTKVNELPQLWNVLIGNMSLVGPRPEDVDIAKSWPDEVKMEILSVNPGITSPASILYHDEEHLLAKANVMGIYFKEILPDKLRLDRLYIRNQSFSADLDIIFWTMVILFPQISKTGVPEGLLFSGPISRFVHRYFSWFVIDLVTSLAVVGTIGILWRLQMPLNWGFGYLAALAVVLAFIFSGVNSLVGLNRIVWSTATIEEGVGLSISGLVVTLILLLLDYFQSIYDWFSLPPLPVIMVLLIGLVSQLGFLIVRYRLRFFTSMASQWLNWRKNTPGLGERILIVGSGEGFQTAVWLLRRDEFRYLFTIVGVVDDDIPTQLGMWINGCLVLGNTEDIPDLVEKYDVGVILFTMPKLAPRVKEIINYLCKTCDLRISFVNHLVKTLSQQLTLPVAALDNPYNLEDSLKYLALHDSDTGLPNRFSFRDQLLRSMAYSRRYKTRFTVMFIQLDGYSSLFNLYGKKVCRELLKQLITRMLKFKRESDTLAYLEDGEFGLILENVSDESVYPIIAKRIHSAAIETFNISGHKICLHPLISICTDLDDCSQLSGVGNEEIDAYLTHRKTVSLPEGSNDGLA